MTDETRPESSAEVAVAETLAISGESDATRGSSPAPVTRSGRQSIVPVGTVVGRYVLAERIGAGGMGNVYRANDPKLDRDVAVKLVAATDVEAAQQYLEREAQAMAKLSHPNVATVHDIGTWNGQLFIAMELCTGGSLATWLAAERPWRDVVKRFIAAGRGLAAAHRIGLVHRDFKPDNVLVTSDGTIRVSDFGLVRSSSGAVVRATSSELIEGTPAYMAPEQLEGNEVDARADQFAFAVSIWEGVCGGRPFQPESRDVIGGMLRAIRGRRFMRSTRSDVPNRVLKILARALDADPARRWPSVAALVDELERVIKPSRLRWIAIGVGAVVVAVGVTVAIAIATRPVPDMMAVHESAKRALVPIYIALGEMSAIDDPLNPSAEAKPMISALAYQYAFNLSGDNNLRPKLARALHQSGRCTEAMLELEAYLRDGGAEVFDEDIRGGITIQDGRQVKTRLDRARLFDIRRECDNAAAMAGTAAELEQLSVEYWRRGHTDRAIDALERAYKLDPEPNYILRMGDIRRAELACDAARSYYQQYLLVEKHAPDTFRKSVEERAKTCGEQR